MASESVVLDFEYLWVELLQAGVVFQRPSVQLQILGLAVSILSSWLISKWTLIQLEKKFPSPVQVETSESVLSWREYGTALVYYLLPPTLNLVVVSWLRFGFQQSGYLFGYISDGIEVLENLWLYFLVLVSFYALFPAHAVSRYHKRFFAPLFYLFIAGKIANYFLDLQAISQINLLDLFGQVITLKTAFIAIAGLYFWIVGTSLLEKILYKLFLHSNFEESRVIQISLLLFRYFLIGLGIVIIFNYVGINTTAIAAITGGLSVGIGFGLKEVISNFISGIWLLFEGALKPGDIITIDGKMSKVTKLGMRATTVQVLKDNSEQIIPNQFFFTQSFSTLTGSNHLIYSALSIRTSQDCEPSQVIAILLQIAHGNPRVLEDPSPQAFALGFGDSSIDFELKFWLDTPLIVKSVTSDLVSAIWQAFNNHNIEIIFPQRELYIHCDDQGLNLLTDGSIVPLKE